MPCERCTRPREAAGDRVKPGVRWAQEVLPPTWPQVSLSISTNLGLCMHSGPCTSWNPFCRNYGPCMR